MPEENGNNEDLEHIVCSVEWGDKHPQERVLHFQFSDGTAVRNIARKHISRFPALEELIFSNEDACGEEAGFKFAFNAPQHPGWEHVKAWATLMRTGVAKLTSEDLEKALKATEILGDKLMSRRLRARLEADHDDADTALSNANNVSPHAHSNGQGISTRKTVNSHGNPPSEIKGVKWKQFSDDNFMETKVDWWLAKPTGASKLQVLEAVAKMANSIVIRVDAVQRFRQPMAENHEKAMHEIVEAIKTAVDNSADLNIYLWGRVWMERNGLPNRGDVAGGAKLAKDLFTPVLTKAKDSGVLDHISGIILVENNTCKIENSKMYAIRIAQLFNEEKAWTDEEGNGFFKSRTFMMPGAGFGLDYRNVGNDEGAFLGEIEKECAYFAFLYKYMHAAHETVTCCDYDDVTCNGTSRAWVPDMCKNAGCFSAEDRKAYLDHFGLSELVKYVKEYQDLYPAATNIVFWGDCWDGISKTPPRSRKAIQNSFGNLNKKVGYFVNLAAYVTDNESARKFYLLDDKLAPNSILGWSGQTIAEEWEMWGREV